MQILKLDRQAKSTERLVKKQQDGTLGQTEGNDMSEEDETIVNFGDITITQAGKDTDTRNEADFAPQPVTTPTDNSPDIRSIVESAVSGLKPKSSDLLKTALIAGTAALGGGYATSFFLPDPIPAVDTDTRYDVDFVDPQSQP